MSRSIKFSNVSMPESVIAGQSFIISVGVTVLDVLYDNTQNEMVDCENKVLLPSDGEYISAYSGEEIDNFIKEVLG